MWIYTHSIADGESPFSKKGLICFDSASQFSSSQSAHSTIIWMLIHTLVYGLDKALVFNYIDLTTAGSNIHNTVYLYYDSFTLS